MKFPRLTRKQNKACKLTDSQIQEAKDRHSEGESYAAIARDYNVTAQAIYYWVLPDDVRNERTAKRNEKRKNLDRTPFDYKEYRERKKEIHGDELKEYENKTSKNWRKQNKEKVKKYSKEYDASHREEKRERSKRWQRKNLEYFRSYNRERNRRLNNIDEKDFRV